jgi:hypothetical protein
MYISVYFYPSHRLSFDLQFGYATVSFKLYDEQNEDGWLVFIDHESDEVEYDENSSSILVERHGPVIEFRTRHDEHMKVNVPEMEMMPIFEQIKREITEHKMRKAAHPIVCASISL